MNQPLCTIVAGIATLDTPDPLLPAAIALARRTGARLHLVHVYPGDAEAAEWHFATRPILGNAVDADSRELSLWLELQAHGMWPGGSVECAALPGRAGEVLPRYAAEVGASLLVLAPTHRQGAAGAVLGTTAARVLRVSTVPVLVLRDALAQAPARRVLLPTDLSQHSARALPLARELASALAGSAEQELWPLFVSVPELDAEGTSPATVLSEAGAEMAGFLASVPGFASIRGSVHMGFPAHHILAVAREWGADLVVLGTHGRRGLPRFFLGSVAETVLRKAPCSALVIPPAAARVAIPLAAAAVLALAERYDRTAPARAARVQEQLPVPAAA
ncbi:MAG TPA: universal stress protein [Longimicrobium sp.]|nr:universal stress protein [Longimicrobium sp.]